MNYTLKTSITALSAAILLGCGAAQSTAPEQNNIATATSSEAQNKTQIQTVSSGQTEKAILAGGCFWCMESDYDKLPGVINVVSGFSGDDLRNPTYRNHAQHVEVVEVTYDPAIVSYDEILDYYWLHIDPTDDGGQFCDRGHAYIPVIFANPNQIAIANASKAEIERTKPFADPIVVPVLPAKEFWPAEEYHQDFYQKNPAHYNRYRKGCRRDAVINSLWGSQKKVKANTSYGSGN